MVLYSLVIKLYGFCIFLFSFFNGKARLWYAGRKDWRLVLHNKMEGAKGKEVIWMHCASLGEFEQGRPVLERIKKQLPNSFLLLTFFSPSGYEIRKNYSLADYVCYLPLDTVNNASDFISLVNPAKVLMVKYEFWFNYLNELSRRKIPFYYFSSSFRPTQYFFKWYGKWALSIIKKANGIFVQDELSFKLLVNGGFSNVVRCGDTRADRVLEIANASKVNPLIEVFKGEEKLFVVGSAWQTDDEVLRVFFREVLKPENKVKVLLAPHDISENRLNQVLAFYKEFRPILYTQSSADRSLSDSRFLVLDTIGMLASVYKYANVVYVGGGFGKTVHNTLEPAAHGKPIVFGPNFNKFPETIGLLKAGGAFTINGATQLKSLWDTKLVFPGRLEDAGIASKSYVANNSGATDAIVAGIFHTGF